MTNTSSLTLLLAIGLSLFSLSCNQETKTGELVNADTTTVPGTTAKPGLPVFDPARDPLVVEAQFLKLLADTLNVQLYEVTFKPGDSVALHTHPDFILYVLEGGTMEIVSEGASPQVVEFKTGMGMVLPSESHAAKNTGKSTVRLLAANIYRPRS
ncbi:MAG TPA: cupin domain-containing protein [Chitinophagaceae bacterium]|nr:cupin domain-containing protein [Chitinophagaceae bacterium]